MILEKLKIHKFKVAVYIMPEDSYNLLVKNKFKDLEFPVRFESQMKNIKKYRYLILVDEIGYALWILDVNDGKVYTTGSKKYFEEKGSNFIDSLKFLYCNFQEIF